MKKILSLVIAFAMVALTAMTAFADTATPYTIFGVDSRETVPDTTISPYSAVCNLIITWENGVTYGTGFLISPTRVVTTAHCLYDRSTGKAAKSIVVYPGDAPGKHPYSSLKATTSQLHYPSEYDSAEKASKYDYGYIQLSGSFSGTPATLNLKQPTSSDLNSTVTLLGYDLYTPQQYKTKGKINSSSDYQLMHKMDTLGGMSGSPILNGNNQVIGINAYSIEATVPGNKVADDYNDYNKATRIWQDAYDFLRRGL